MAVSLHTIVSTEFHQRTPLLTLTGGRGLGGSSILNGFYYRCGSANVDDHWVELREPRLELEEVYPSFIKVVTVSYYSRLFFL